jgi:hypothetical protein
VPPIIPDVLDEARGRGRRRDDVTPGSGGPAGNARLTAWTGLTLLVLVLAQLLTLVDVRRLVTWHIAIGAVLIPYALLKTGTTTWRMVGYYARRRPYHQAGPPPLVLRVLGPAVVASTLAVLASGVVLVALGPGASRQVLVSGLGQRVDAVTLHQATFVVFDVVVGLHLLARFVPALLLVTGHRDAGSARQVPGRPGRGGAWALAAVAAALSAVLLVHLEGAWRTEGDRRGPPPHAAARPALPAAPRG